MQIKWKMALNNLRVTCVLAIFGNLFINLSQGLGERDLERGIHVGIIFIVLLLTLIKKVKLTKPFVTLLFILVYAPFYFHSWNYHHDNFIAGNPWVPFFPLQVHALILAILYSGTFSVNVFLILGFIFEELLIWFYLDLSHSSHTILFEEPAKSILFYVIAFILLFFRAKNEDYLQELSMAKVRAEEMKSRVNLVLKIRERSDPSLQTLQTGLEIFKVKFPKEVNLIGLLQEAVDRLKSLNAHLRQEEKGPKALPTNEI